MKSTVILCADDFGISPGVNRAILDLATQKRLSAVSCMSSGPFWEEGVRFLKPLKESVAVGLHLTFTYMPLLSEPGKRHGDEKSLLLKSWLRQLDKEAVEQEMRAQFEKFISVWGAAPDFIDGHQHVHVLPVIRDILLKLREEYAPQAWMRNVVDFTALGDSCKYWILAVMGWRWLQKLRSHKIPHNKLLRGTYDYAHPVNYAALMEKWCAAGNGVLIYCHPGFPDAALAKYDTVLEPRQHEYDFFNGEFFDIWLKDRITLVKQP